MTTVTNTTPSISTSIEHKVPDSENNSFTNSDSQSSLTLDEISCCTSPPRWDIYHEWDGDLEDLSYYRLDILFADMMKIIQHSFINGGNGIENMEHMKTMIMKMDKKIPREKKEKEINIFDKGNMELMCKELNQYQENIRNYLRAIS